MLRPRKEPAPLQGRLRPALPEKKIKQEARNPLGVSLSSPGLAAAAVLIACFAAALCSGCEVRYLARAAWEEGRLLWNRRPISLALEEPGLAPELKGRLATVLEVRQFARDRLGIKVGGAYATVTPVDERALVYIVMAAPKTALKPVLWWFPIVGSVPYRGYFDPGEAQAEAAALEAQGLDTLVRPSVAFSSLGFFNDPLPSNLLTLSRVELAGVIIHELFHRTFFLPSDVMFNESAANWVGSAGAVAFFEQTEGARSADAVAARAALESDFKLADFLLKARARLLSLYTSGAGEDEIIRRRQPIFAQIKAEYARIKPALSGLERFDLDTEPLNNAVMLNYLLYFCDLGDFAALNRLYGGEVRRTIEAIIALAQSDAGDPFHAVWRATRGVPGAPP